MPRTLLLALIVTAISACNKSEAAPGAKAPDNVRKLPLSGCEEAHLKKTAEKGSALAH